MKQKKRSRKWKLMIVESDVLMRPWLAKILSEHDVLVASNGEQALAFVHLHSPIHLVICDHDLPGWDGLETLNRIRAKSPKTKLMLMSERDPYQLTPHAHEAKGIAWLNKPISLYNLFQWVNHLLSNQKMK